MLVQMAPPRVIQELLPSGPRADWQGCLHKKLQKSSGYSYNELRTEHEACFTEIGADSFGLAPGNASECASGSFSGGGNTRDVAWQNAPGLLHGEGEVDNENSTGSTRMASQTSSSSASGKLWKDFWAAS